MLVISSITVNYKHHTVYTIITERYYNVYATKCWSPPTVYTIITERYYNQKVLMVNTTSTVYTIITERYYNSVGLPLIALVLYTLLLLKGITTTGAPRHCSHNCIHHYYRKVLQPVREQNCGDIGCIHYYYRKVLQYGVTPS